MGIPYSPSSGDFISTLQNTTKKFLCANSKLMTNTGATNMRNETNPAATDCERFDRVGVSERVSTHDKSKLKLINYLLMYWYNMASGIE